MQLAKLKGWASLKGINLLRKCYRCNAIIKNGNFAKHGWEHRKRGDILDRDSLLKYKRWHNKFLREHHPNYSKLKSSTDLLNYRMKSIDERKKISKEQLERRRKIGYEYVPKHYKKKIKVRRLLRTTIENGTVKKPSKCSKCNSSNKSVRIEAHHKNYNKPYDVIWLCTMCHRKKHWKKIHV